LSLGNFSTSWYSNRTIRSCFYCWNFLSICWW